MTFRGAEVIRDLTIVVVCTLASLPAWAAARTPTQWIEPATGHRVVRLSAEEGARKLYFHQNAFTESGDKLLIIAADGPATVDMKTYKIESLGVVGRAMGLVVGKKSRQVYYSRNELVLATHLDTHKTRQLGHLPPEIRGGSRFAVNADETLLAGSTVEAGMAPRPPVEARGAPQPGGGERRGLEASLERRWAARLPMRLFTVEINSGKVKTFAPSTDWLNGCSHNMMLRRECGAAILIEAPPGFFPPTFGESQCTYGQDGESALVLPTRSRFA